MKIREMTTLTNQIRKDILTMGYNAKSAHIGGALSAVEILVALYFDCMHVNPKNPTDETRDRFIFSKAHDAKALYATLSRRGYFSSDILKEYAQNNNHIPDHTVRHSVPGVESSVGSLGHGLPMACGIAYGLKLNKANKSPRVFAVLSDGECDEGSTWEAALFAGHHALDNLVVIIDYNKLQGYGYTKDILDLEPFADKWNSFGFTVVEEPKGNDISSVIQTFRRLPSFHNKPVVVIVHTVKGFGGIPEYIGQVSCQYRSPTKEEYEEAIKRLS
jgi:transketolase